MYIYCISVKFMFENLYKKSRQINSEKKVKVNVSYGQEPLREESTIYHRLLGKLSTTCSKATEVAQWATSSCSRP